MGVINLNENESKLLNAVIDEMKDIPDVNFDNVAQKVGIKYGKNARQSFKKIWGKMKGGDATASNGGDAEESDDAESSNKAAVKAATPKKAPAAKKGVGKANTPKKASEAGPKTTRTPRKTKKQKEEEAAAAADADAAETAEQDDNEDEDMKENNEDGKSLQPKALVTATKRIKAKASIKDLSSPVASALVEVEEFVAADKAEAKAAPKMGDIDLAEASSFVEAKAEVDPTAAAYAEARKDYVTPVMYDEHEATIREMPLQAWLKWKAESGYTFDLLNA